MNLVDQAKDIQGQIDETFRTAYEALQKANMEMGIAFVDQISHTVPVEDSIRIKTRSVMGTEIPLAIEEIVVVTRVGYIDCICLMMTNPKIVPNFCKSTILISQELF